jgi:hypothetical protein
MKQESIQLENEIKEKTVLLANASRTLEDVNKKLAKSSATSAEYEKKVKSKKSLVIYNDRNNDSVIAVDEVAYFCEAIKNEACDNKI